MDYTFLVDKIRRAPNGISYLELKRFLTDEHAMNFSELKHALLEAHKRPEIGSYQYEGGAIMFASRTVIETLPKEDRARVNLLLGDTPVGWKELCEQEADEFVLEFVGNKAKAGATFNDIRQYLLDVLWTDKKLVAQTGAMRAIDRLNKEGQLVAEGKTYWLAKYRQKVTKRHRDLPKEASAPVLSQGFDVDVLSREENVKSVQIELPSGDVFQYPLNSNIIVSRAPMQSLTLIASFDTSSITFIYNGDRSSHTIRIDKVYIYKS